MARKILVVDDEPHIVKLCQVNLERAGYEVISASNGEEALTKIKNDKPDLVILDLAMPIKSGFDVLTELLAEKIEVPPTVILTAKDIERETAQNMALITIYCVYMPKPFKPLDLLDFVNRMLSTEELTETA